MELPWLNDCDSAVAESLDQATHFYFSLAAWLWRQSLNLVGTQTDRYYCLNIFLTWSTILHLSLSLIAQQYGAQHQGDLCLLYCIVDQTGDSLDREEVEVVWPFLDFFSFFTIPTFLHQHDCVYGFTATDHFITVKSGIWIWTPLTSRSRYHYISLESHRHLILRADFSSCHAPRPTASVALQSNPSQNYQQSEKLEVQNEKQTTLM